MLCSGEFPQKGYTAEAPGAVPPAGAPPEGAAPGTIDIGPPRTGAPPVPGATIPASEANPVPQVRIEAINNLLVTTTDPAAREELEKEKALLEVKQGAAEHVAEVKQTVENLQASNAPKTAEALAGATASNLDNVADKVSERVGEITPAGYF